MNTNLVVRKRIAGLFLIIAGILFLLILRLGWLQFVRGEELQEKAVVNRLRQVPVEAKRGVIYDRNGKELAVSISTDSVGAFPAEVKHADAKNPGTAEKIAAQLASILDMPQDKVYQLITKNSSFVWVKRKIGFEAGPKIKQLELPGIEVYEESQRYYPNGTLAAHILGFAGIDNQGLEGLEVTYDEELRGKRGKIVIEFDATGRAIPEAVHKYIPPVDGHNLVLTIDETIQYIVERELDRVMAEKQAKSATIIVMDPKTGGILALGSRPTYNPNNYKEFPQQNWRNIATSNAYEPGSTFKIITAAAAMEEAVVKPEDRFYDPGYIKVGKETIKCWRSYKPHGSQSFVEGVQNSCNPVFVELGLRLEEKEKGLFYDYVKAFGFGQKTGIQLRGEAKGIMIPEEKLKLINVATIAMGQSIAVTPLQLVRAVSAVANGGKLMQPQLVKEIRDKDGNLVEAIEPVVEKQVLSEQTAKKLAEILEGVVSEGTGRNAYIPGFRVGGKTGTAQKPGPGGYMQGKYVASFIGLAPVNDPQVVALVVVDEPQGVYYGGQVAAPVFKRVVEDTLRYLGVTPQYNAQAEHGAKQEEGRLSTVPDLVGLPVIQAEKVAKAAGLTPAVQGEGPYVVKQTPKSGAKVKPGTKAILYAGERQGDNEQLKVPDVTGLRISEAARLLEALGLEMIPVGSGVAVEQEPIPATLVPQGTKVKVRFREEQTVETIGP
ncbi:stage V sporulation protein D [Zhaonella formicivorans]|uniref:stage V sporulation protein D n=1 Tax=Zhaonella formicivorans TaxID=2528593 RepID=UPI0010D1CAA0|nr:stage V sporulation protein D [Zhaonella formicivorans]